jgi:hypothetical protein
MKSPTRFLARPLGAAVGTLLLASAALGQAQGQAQAQAQAPEASGVAYIAGGVGESGRAEIEAVQAQYSLKLVFAYTNGEFLAQVKVVISDAAGETLVSTDADGPWLLVNLPAGTYTVAATVNGETKTEQVSVPASGLKTVNILWPPAS